MSAVLLWHNPRCSKSRAALALLCERGVDVEPREYLKKPPTRAELEELRDRLELPVRSWVRVKEEAFAAAGLTDASDDDALLDAIAAHPILLERPIAVVGGRARVGRPPERVLELLDPEP
jgi:arsenate reductase